MKVMVDQSKAIDVAKERMQPVKTSNPNLAKWVGGGIVSISFIGLIGLVSVSFLGHSDQISTENQLQIPSKPLFGFWQDKSHPADYWIAKAVQTAPNRFAIKWNGSAQRDGKGNGAGSGVGIIQSDGKVHIEIDETMRLESSQSPLLTLPGMSTGEKTQKLILEGKYYQKADGHSFFEGDYVERGAKFYPFTHWVLEPELPKGWTMPGQ
jgi:hypothetical protein